MQQRAQERNQANQQANQGWENSLNYFQNTLSDVGNKLYAREQAGEERARQDKELNRQVSDPLNDFLNHTMSKVQSGQLDGTTGARLAKLVQNGNVSVEDATTHLNSLDSANGIGGAITPPPSGGVAAGPEIKEPTDPQYQQISPGTPVVNGLRAPRTSNPGLSESLPPPAGKLPTNLPMPGPPVGMTQQAPQGLAPQGLAPQIAAPKPQVVAQAPTSPPPPAHRWTVRDLNDLHAAGGIPQQSKKTEADYMMEVLKEQGRNNRNENTVTGQGDINDAKIKQRATEMSQKMDNWSANRKQHWDEVQARLEALQKSRASGADAKRDEALMKEVAGTLAKRRDENTRLRTSLGSLAKDPNVLQQIEQDDQDIAQLEQRLADMRAQVQSRVPTTVTPPTTSTQSSSGPVLPPAAVPPSQGYQPQVPQATANQPPRVSNSLLNRMRSGK